MKTKKRCNCCHNSKPLSEFTRHGEGRAYSSYCKPCTRQSTEDREHREEIARSQKILSKLAGNREELEKRFKGLEMENYEV